MAKNVMTEQELLDEQAAYTPEDGPKWPAKVTVALDSFVDDVTKEKREFISIRLANPFPDDPDVPDFRLATKWESDSAIFKYRALKYLRQHENIVLDGVIRPVTYYNKKFKKDVTYIGLYVPDPFIEDRLLELRIRDERSQGLFSTLFRDLWNLHNVTVEPVKEKDEE